MIPAEAVEAAAKAALGRNLNKRTLELILEAAAPHIMVQALEDAVAAFPLETIVAPDNAVVWMARRADEIRGQA